MRFEMLVTSGSRTGNRANSTDGDVALTIDQKFDVG